MLPKRIDREIIYENEWVNLYVDKVEYPDGRVLDRHHLIHFDNASVGTVMTDGADRVLLIRSSRYATQSEEWEIPAGGVENGETPEEAAIREALEETGYGIIGLTLLCKENPLNGISDSVHYLYRARVTEKGELLTPEEVMSAKWFSLPEIRKMIRGREIHCGMTLIGLLMELAGLSAPE